MTTAYPTSSGHEYQEHSKWLAMTRIMEEEMRAEARAQIKRHQSRRAIEEGLAMMGLGVGSAAIVVAFAMWGHPVASLFAFGIILAAVSVWTLLK